MKILDKIFKRKPKIKPKKKTVKKKKRVLTKEEDDDELIDMICDIDVQNDIYNE